MDSLTIAASGMRVASLRLDAAASNVARLPVEGEQGLGVAVGTAPASDLVEARSAVLAFDAHARLLHAGGEMLGFFLDVTA